ncbi:MAG: DUF4386 domain-containing protein [Acidobacteriota bacterium]
MEPKVNTAVGSGRFAGLLWFLGAATAGFSLVYVRPHILVSGDAAATVANMIAFEPLFRAGIVSMILSHLFLMFFGLAIFSIFQNVDKPLATVCLLALLVGGGIGILNSTYNLGAITLVTNPDYTQSLQPGQLNTIASVLLRMNNFGIGLVEIFTSIFLFSLGLLVLRSKYMPAAMGFLLLAGSFGFPLNTFTKILVPGFYPNIFTQLAMLGGALGGAIPMFWLLIMGTKRLFGVEAQT